MHPDGRLQRLRPAIGRPRGAGGYPGSGVRPLWQVIVDVAKALGYEHRRLPHRRAGLAAAVRGRAVLRRAHARGDRRPRRALGRARGVRLARLGGRDARDPAGRAGRRRDGKLRLGTYRPLWAAKEVDLSPALQFIRARQVAELSPADAAALGHQRGRPGRGRQRHARARAGQAARRDPGRQRVPRRGHARGQRQRAHAPAGRDHAGRAGLVEPSAVPAQIQPAVEGLAEAPPSAGLPIPPREVT